LLCLFLLSILSSVLAQALTATFAQTDTAGTKEKLEKTNSLLPSFDFACRSDVVSDFSDQFYCCRFPHTEGTNSLYFSVLLFVFAFFISDITGGNERLDRVGILDRVLETFP
jgi:hypothetical protein